MDSPGSAPPSFWDVFEEPAPPAPPPTLQNHTINVCQFCRRLSADVLLGVCEDCAPKEDA